MLLKSKCPFHPSKLGILSWWAVLAKDKSLPNLAQVSVRKPNQIRVEN